jgi:hypothetical protein
VDNPYQAPAFDEHRPGAGQAGEYEFSESEAAIVAKAGRRARLWGAFSFIMGVLFLMGGLLAIAGSGLLLASGGGGKLGGLLGAVLGGAAIVIILSGFAQCASGAAYVSSGSSLISAAQTHGNDMNHLMQSVRRLGTAFQIETIVTGLLVAATLAVRFLGLGVTP